MKQHQETELLHHLQLKGRLELAEVVDMLQISESTARRLFTRLEAEGKVLRVHGGIQIPWKSPTEYSFERLVKAKVDEKNAIAEKACNLLEDGDVIFCDAGTTMLCFCMRLKQRLEQEPMKLIVFTNSLANFEVLSPCVPITLIGGSYREYRKDFCGYLAELALGKVHFTKCFLGTDGCDMKNCFTTTDFDTAKLDEIAIQNSSETVILCDSGKFGSCAQVGYAEFDAVDRVISDAGMPSAAQQLLKSHGIEVIRTT